MFANVVSASVTKVAPVRAVSDARKASRGDIKGQIKEKTERRAKLKKVRMRR